MAVDRCTGACRPVRHIGLHVRITLPPRRVACPSIGRRQAARASGEGEPTGARVDAAPTRRGALLSAAASAVLGTAAAPAQGTTPFCGLFELPDGRQALPMYVYKLPWEESTTKFAGGETWTRVVGSAKEEARASKTLLPVVMLHGGPGLCSRYLEPMELLGQTARRLAFYDQYGSGFSSRNAPPGDTYSVELFVDQVDAVRDSLGLGGSQRVHLFGHGWGGMLALQYMLSGAPGASTVASLTLASTAASAADAATDRRAAANTLPPATRDLLLSGKRDDSGYAAAMDEYSRTFVSTKLPGCLTETRAALDSPAVADAMMGADMFTPGGILADWSVKDRLNQVNVPVLLTRGRQDEVAATTTASLAKALPNARVQTFAGGSCSMIDDWEYFLESIDEFMLGVEQMPPPSA